MQNSWKRNLRMDVAILDKCWFLDHPEMRKVETFIDYGCGSGLLARIIKAQFPDADVIGFDSDESQRQNVEQHGIQFVTSLPDTPVHVYEKTAVILSSVLHEMPLWPERPSATQALRVMLSRCRYAVLRDMYWAGGKEVDMTDAFITRLLKYVGRQKFQTFAKHHGDNMNNDRVAMHLACLAMWKDNWDNEVAEKYFQLDWKTLGKYFARFQPIHLETFVHPYYQDQFQIKFGASAVHHAHQSHIQAQPIAGQ